MSWNPIKDLITRSRTLMASTYNPFIVSSNGKIISSDNSVTIQEALKNSDIYACVARISSDLAACSFKTSNPYLKKVLDKPQGTMISGYSTWQSMATQMALRGNAYAAITRDTSGEPIRIEPIPNEKVTPTLNDNGDDIVYTVHYDDANRSGDAQYSSANFLHFRLLTTGESSSQYMGISPLTALGQEIGIQTQSNRLSLATLVHAISPSTFLKVPIAHLNKQAKENIRNSFEEQSSGKNAGRAIVVDQSADVVQSTISPDIAKLIANTTFTQDQIAKAFLIPADFLSGKQDAQSNIDQVRSFYQSSLSAYIEPIKEELRTKLGDDIDLDVDSAIDIDHSQLLSHLGDAVSKQVLTSEQAQKILIARKVYPEINEVQSIDLLKGGENTEKQE